MVLVRTIGSVDTMPGTGPRKMPAPRDYVAIVVTWLVLQFVSGLGANAERAAAMLGWLLVLTGMVLGPFGNAAIKALNNIAQQYGIPPSTPSPSTSPSPPTGSLF